MLKLHKIDEEEIHRLCRFLAAHPIVNWVARFDGHFDVGCTVLAKHVGEVSIFLDIIRRNFHARIREISYAVNLKAEFFPRDYLISDQRRRNNGASYVSFNESKAVLELDATDWTILQELTNNARTTNVQIASRVNISAETVARRIARLEMAGLIGGYRLALDHRALARTNYYLLLHLNVVSNERIERLLAFLRSDARTVYLIKMLGEWDYDVCLEFEDAEAYRAFFINLMKQFAEVIRDVQTHTTWQVIKFSILPAAIFNGTK
jgi:DNA-binding Lrp family transcriptional regulator